MKDNRNSVSELAFLRIKEMLYRNELAPGQKIVCVDLAKKLNISVTPVIQALKSLEASKLVNYVRNRGYFVGIITEKETKDLYQAREALELYLIPTIVENLNAEILDVIYDTFRNYRHTVDEANRRELILLDCKFHLTICELGKNEVINRQLKDIFEQIYLRYRGEYLQESRIDAIVNEHRELLTALRKGEIGNAMRITRHHIRGGMETVIRGATRINLLKEDDIFY